MEGLKTDPQNSYERNERVAQDIKFVRNFFRFMDQTRVLRWRKEHHEPFTSPDEVREMKESDAEHTGQMNALATFIIMKARKEGDASLAGTSLDILKINAMIQLHDIEENRVGDSRSKDESYYTQEKMATDEVTAELGTMNFGVDAELFLREYKERTTPEARFVKAIDEVQALFYMIYTRGHAESNRDYKNPDTVAGYVCAKDFPTLQRVADILIKMMVNPNRISPDVPTMELIKEQYGKPD